MESIIKDDILAYMVSNKLLTNLQHGLVPGKSCQSNLLLMLNFLTKLIENGTDADIVDGDGLKGMGWRFPCMPAGMERHSLDLLRAVKNIVECESVWNS